VGVKYAMGAVENVKEIADLVKRFNDIELNRRILSLENEVLDLSRDKRRLEEKVEELQRTLKFKEELEFKEPFYWKSGDATPYCPGCWESKRAAIHVSLVRLPGLGDMMQCPSCKFNYRARRGV
jgi:hypothetical protein